MAKYIKCRSSSRRVSPSNSHDKEEEVEDPLHHTDEEYDLKGEDESKLRRRSNSIGTAVQRLIIKSRNNASCNTPPLSSTAKKLLVVNLVVFSLLFFSTSTRRVLFSVPSSVTTAVSPLSTSTGMVDGLRKKILRENNVDLSIVISLRNEENYDHLLAKLLPSIVHQTPSNFEIVVVDNGCLSGTKKIVLDAFQRECTAKGIPYKYLPLCGNLNYALGNNKGVDAASKISKWIMFLQDDLVLQGEDFLKNMMDIGATKTNVGGVVCKLLTEDGEEIVEAGRLLWNDAKTDSIGRGEVYTSAPNLSYAKPVDYGSGACLMMKRDLFVDSKGFDYENFPKYYQDADLQLQVQHNLNKEIWFQPLAVAFQTASFTRDNEAMMPSSLERFIEKWGEQLEAKHLENPFALSVEEKELQFFRASDLRARDTSKANILWLEQAAPNYENGSGFGRAFDNLSIAAGLGHRITLILHQKITASWCDKKCRDKITNLGVEMITGPWEEYVDKYIDFYDIVYISRPIIFQMTYEKWQEAYKKHSFTLIYDCEALWHQRNQLLVSLLEDEDKDEEKERFPGGLKYLGLTDSRMDMELVNLEIKNEKDSELKLIQMADSVLAVSEKEKDTILELLPDTEVYTVGHAMRIDESRMLRNTFQQRSGILFVASFSDNMYYNGDAVWYFLTEVYPLVLKDSESPIPFTIAGKDIPKDLYELVERDELLSRNVIFHESVADTNELYDSARIIIAPHLYGAGIHYKVSKAFSLGIPTVMSSFTADSFGIDAEDSIGCVAKNAEKMKSCILDLNTYEEMWDRVKQNELKFIQEGHDRDHITELLDNAIEVNLERIKTIRKEGDSHKMEHSLVTTIFDEVTEPCPEGEKYYGIKYRDAREAVEAGIFESFFFHYHHFGKIEGRKYPCFEHKSDINDDPTESSSIEGEPTESSNIHNDPTEPCPEGEEAYGRDYPDVKEAVEAGTFESMFSHYVAFGKEEGKEYLCTVDRSSIEGEPTESSNINNDPTEPCPEGEEAYGRDYPDVKEAVEAGTFESMFSHYVAFGKEEGKKYWCTVDRSSMNNDPTEPCPEGEEAYGRDYPDVKEAVEAGTFESMFSHYVSFGKEEGKKYSCIVDRSSIESEATEPCPVGEEAYGRDYPDVKEAVEAGIFESMFSHYVAFGKEEGKKYVCLN